jgi:hypothetical protein
LNKVLNLAPKIHLNSPVSIYNVKIISGGKPPDPHSREERKEGRGREGREERPGEEASPHI